LPKNLKLYKGVDNTFKIQFKNQDQKSVNITGKTLKFHIIKDGTSTSFVTKNMNIIDGAKGIATVVVLETDLFNLHSRMYNFSITVTDEEGNEVVAYSDDNYGVRGTIELLNGHYPEFKEAITLTVNEITFLTDYVPCTFDFLRTFQVFFTNYTGDIVIQATLDDVPNSLDTTWFDVETISYTAQTASQFINVEGKYTFMRVKTVPISGSVVRILFRG